MQRKTWYWVQNIEFRILSSEYWVQNIEYRILSTEYWVQNIEYRILSTEYWVQNIEHKILNNNWVKHTKKKQNIESDACNYKILPSWLLASESMCSMWDLSSSVVHHTSKPSLSSNDCRCSPYFKYNRGLTVL